MSHRPRGVTGYPKCRDIAVVQLAKALRNETIERLTDRVASWTAKHGLGSRVEDDNSLIGVERNRVVPHYKVEQYLLHSGVPFTFLRPSFFMQNLNTTHRVEIKERSEIFVPAGTGKTSFIDVRDIAAVAALTLTQPGHTNRAYSLTGSEALDYYQVAAVLSEVLGRPIIYRKPSLLRFIRRQRACGTAWPFVLVMSGIYTTARLSLAARLTDETTRLLGRAPITLRRYAEDYRDCW